MTHYWSHISISMWTPCETPCEEKRKKKRKIKDNRISLLLVPESIDTYLHHYSYLAAPQASRTYPLSLRPLCLNHGTSKASSNFERPTVPPSMYDCTGPDKGNIDTGTLPTFCFPSYLTFSPTHLACFTATVITSQYVDLLHQEPWTGLQRLPYRLHET